MQFIFTPHCPDLPTHDLFVGKMGVSAIALKRYVQICHIIFIMLIGNAQYFAQR